MEIVPYILVSSGVFLFVLGILSVVIPAFHTLDSMNEEGKEFIVDSGNLLYKLIIGIFLSVCRISICVVNLLCQFVKILPHLVGITAIIIVAFFLICGGIMMIPYYVADYWFVGVILVIIGIYYACFVESVEGFGMLGHVLIIWPIMFFLPVIGILVFVCGSLLTISIVAAPIAVVIFAVEIYQGNLSECILDSQSYLGLGDVFKTLVLFLSFGIINLYLFCFLGVGNK